MHDTLDEGMQLLSSYVDVTDLDAGEYKEIKMYGLMKFDVKQYEIKEVGNLSVMKVNMGFMQMLSYVMTPYEKDMPMLSMDFMYILSNRKAYAEFYDLTADTASPEYIAIIDKISDFRERYSDLEDIPTEHAWYDDLLSIALHKSGNKQNDTKISEMFSDAIETYMKSASGLELLSDESEKETTYIIQEYSDNLIKNGGVSTDVFKKASGEEKTKDFFDKVFFGTELYN